MDINAVKDHVKRLTTGHYLDNKEDRHGLVDFYMMGGGITLQALPLDLFPMKVMKGCHRDFYDIHMLNTPTNPRMGHSLTPSLQLCATWVVDEWKNVPESLIKNLEC